MRSQRETKERCVGHYYGGAIIKKVVIMGFGW